MNTILEGKGQTELLKCKFNLSSGLNAQNPGLAHQSTYDTLAVCILSSRYIIQYYDVEHLTVFQ